MYSEHPGKEFGQFVRTAGKFYNDEEADKGKCCCCCTEEKEKCSTTCHFSI